MVAEQAGQNADTDYVSVYFHFPAVCKNALAVGSVGIVAIVGATLLRDHGALFVSLWAVGALCVLFALLRFSAAWQWRRFSNQQPYARFERSGLALLDAVHLPWSSIEYLKISRLAWPRRSYLLVGLKSSRAVGAVPPALTADNMLIALASREATGVVVEPQTFLSLCIEANWSPLAPVALTHNARQIVGLAETYFQVQNVVVDREAAAHLFEAAQAALQSGDTAQAQALCGQALEQDGEHDAAWFMLSVIALNGGAQREAEIALRRALALREHPAYAGNLGLLLQETGRIDEAETWLRRALVLAPDDVNPMCSLANLLKDDGRIDEADALYRRVIELDPQGTPAPNNLGLLCWKAGRLAEATDWLQRAIALDPAMADAHGNLGIVQKELGQFAESEASYRRALELQQSARFHSNLGLLFQETGRQREAQEEFERALELDPNYALGRYNLSLTRLAFGDYARGLPDFESRYDPISAESPVKLPALPFAQWRGESLAGKRLVVWPEQGFGDYLQFARYFPLLRQQGLARLTVCCSAVIAPVLQTVEGVDAVVSEQGDLGDHDYWAFPMSLALHCSSDRADIPAHLPYLHALPERLARWQPLLKTAKPKIGLVWKGAPGHKNDANRSLPSLQTLSPLWHAADVQCFSLQKGQGEDEARAEAAAGRLIHLGEQIADLGDTAAIVAQLDLVICVDTAIAHLAGGLGKRCWVLLPAVGCDWRWHIDRADSPWYPEVMRLFRQGRTGDWSQAVSELAQALQQTF